MNYNFEIISEIEIYFEMWMSKYKIYILEYNFIFQILYSEIKKFNFLMF